MRKGRLERVSDYREAIAQISTGGTRDRRDCVEGRPRGARLSRDVRGGCGRDGGAAAIPAGGTGAQCDLPDGDRGLSGGDAGSADRVRVRAGVPRDDAGVCADVRRPGAMAGRGRGEVRLPRRVASVHRGAGDGDAGAASEAGELPPGREFVDVRDRPRADRWTRRWASRRNRAWRTRRGTGIWMCSRCCI